MMSVDVNTSAATGPVSPAHRFDEARLLDWLRLNATFMSGHMTVQQFEGGQSNPTFLLQGEHGSFVLRKKPPGKLMPSAHAIDREFRVLKALEHTSVPTPKPILYCDDDTVIGSAFYIMEFVEGRILTDPLLSASTPIERAALYDSMNQTLAELHMVDWRAAGLDDYGKAEGYFARQIARWQKQYEAARIEPIPDLDALLAWLLLNIPADESAAIAHGDFRIGNLVFHPREPRVVAVLDWELSTIGHPFADLAYNCMTYHLLKDDPVAPGFIGANLSALGIPSESEYVSQYGRRTGRDPAPLWRFAMAFSLFRTAAIQQGVYVRSLQGNANSDMAARFGESCRRVAAAGWKVAQARG